MGQYHAAAPSRGAAPSPACDSWIVSRLTPEESCRLLKNFGLDSLQCGIGAASTASGLCVDTVDSTSSSVGPPPTCCSSSGGAVPPGIFHYNPRSSFQSLFSSKRLQGSNGSNPKQASLPPPENRAGIDAVSVVDFLAHAPLILRPFLSLILPVLGVAVGKTLKTHGKLPAASLIAIGSICAYPRPLELERIIVQGLIASRMRHMAPDVCDHQKTKAQSRKTHRSISPSSRQPSRDEMMTLEPSRAWAGTTVTGSNSQSASSILQDQEEDEIVIEFLTFAYLLCLFVLHPMSPLFTRAYGLVSDFLLPKSMWASMASCMKANTSSDGEQIDPEKFVFPPVPTPDSSGTRLGGASTSGWMRHDSWDIFSVFPLEGSPPTCQARHTLTKLESSTERDKLSCGVQRLTTLQRQEQLALFPLADSFAKFKEICRRRRSQMDHRCESSTGNSKTRIGDFSFESIFLEWLATHMQYISTTLSFGLKRLLFHRSVVASGEGITGGSGPAECGSGLPRNPRSVDQLALLSQGSTRGLTRNPRSVGDLTTPSRGSLEVKLLRATTGTRWQQGAGELPVQADGSQQEGWRGYFLGSASKCITDELGFALRQALPEFRGNRWTRLFATWIHGRSMTRFASSVLFYPAGTVLVVSTTDGSLFGASISTPWRETVGSYFGLEDMFLWRFLPFYSLNRTTGTGSNFCYFNAKNSAFKKGIGFGGKPECFRLWIDEEFHNGYSCNSDSTFEVGSLARATLLRRGSSNGSNNNIKSDLSINREDPVGDTGDFMFSQVCFEIQQVEVWGVGDHSALNEQRIAQQREEELRLERRMVDKRKLADNQFDRQYLLGNTFRDSERLRS